VTSLARRQSPLGTLAQSLPRLRAILGNMRPTWHMPDARAITPAFLAAQAIDTIVWDVDGTLTHFHDTHLAQDFAVMRAPGVDHAILSNADERRFQELGSIFPTIPICKGYRIDGVLMVRALLGGRDSFPQVLRDRIGADGVVPLRKPDGALLAAVIAHLGRDPGRTVMVGDQYFTDIAGANLAGVRSIKLRAIGWTELPPGIRFGQRVEQLCYRLLHGAPRWDSVPATQPPGEDAQ
jgi:predicted HAD superfamily phosphohydrolase YqeG